MKHLLRLTLLFSIFWLASCQKDSDDAADDQPNANALSTGASANDFLAAEKFDKLLVEIQYPQDWTPPQGSVDDLKDFFDEHCHKPAGIEVVSTELSMPARDTYTLDDVKAIEDEHRTKFNDGTTLTLYIFVAGGNYEQNSESTTTLGVAYRNTSFAVFQKPIREHTGGVLQPSERAVTSAIFNHEAGHLLGLVNIGSPMVEDHQDTEHGHHCSNEDCLMYWALNSAATVGDLINSSSPPELDADCKADLQAHGGK